jgi:peptide/nickel transport system ATP-binding protein
MTGETPLLEVDRLSVAFPAPGSGLFGLGRRWLRAVNDVSLTVRPGETLGLVGESGSGKSTLGRAMLGLGPVTSGTVRFRGREISVRDHSALASLRRQTAMVFQDPFNALNPRMTIGQTLGEVLRVHGRARRGSEAAAVAALMETVGLSPALSSRRPRELSGGQCQRAGIARALAVEPSLIVADECVAALDVSIQGQIVNLLMQLTAERHLALVFIAHDLALVRRLCSRVAVMYLGRIVEEGPTERVMAAPNHPYTAALMRAVPSMDPDQKLPEDPGRGDPPSPLDLPPGCPFHPRCAHARDACRSGPPPAMRQGQGRAWACILEPGEALDRAA